LAIFACTSQKLDLEPQDTDQIYTKQAQQIELLRSGGGVVALNLFAEPGDYQRHHNQKKHINYSRATKRDIRLVFTVAGAGVIVGEAMGDMAWRMRGLEGTTTRGEAGAGLDFGVSITNTEQESNAC
jgi:hypothetical protein